MVKRSDKLSRSAIELYLECPRCFYLDKMYGVRRPGNGAFHINNAIDKLLKKEFDIHRMRGEAHPLMSHYGIDAVPFVHDDLEKWRDALHHGVQYLHTQTGFLVYGAPDDIWVDDDEKLMVVDYKATSLIGGVSRKQIYGGYGRQLEVYQWLLRQNGFAVYDVGYFVYCNGKQDSAAFDGRLEFDVQIFEYKGDTDWIEPVLFTIREVLSGEIPASSDRCSFCAYIASANSHRTLFS